MKNFITAIICISSICIALYAYYGGFKNLKIQIAVQGGESVVYSSITGDYRQSGVVMDKIYSTLLNDYKIETFKGYGKYFDNPKIVEKSKLRSEAGCIIESKDTTNASYVTGECKYKILPEQKYIVTEFPYKGKLSVILSVMKVYPALNKFAEKNGLNGVGAVIEIYDIPNKKIYYRMEILE